MTTIENSAKANFADEVQVVLSLMQEQNFVKGAFLDSEKPLQHSLRRPAVQRLEEILYVH